MKAVIKIAIAMLGAAVALSAGASGGGAKMPEGVNYIPLESPLVVNYGGPGKSRFIRVELSLRAENATDATEILHHLPLIRDRLISILSKQSEEVISTPAGKEYMRVYALAEINAALLKVTGHHPDGHDNGADDEHGAAPTDAQHEEKKTEKDTEKDSATANGDASKSVAHDQQQASGAASPSLPSAADVKPVKGPATDLFFNNFIVQK